jgi:hypothetical protein
MRIWSRATELGDHVGVEKIHGRVQPLEVDVTRNDLNALELVL